MSHPSGAHRAHHHEKHRARELYGVSHTGSATIANRITPSDRSMEKKAFKVRDALAVEGGVPKERYDRPGRSLRARGGRTKGGKTTVNVIVAGGAGAGGAGVSPVAPAPRPVPPPTPAPPPMAGPPGGAGVAPPPGGMPPGGAPGMPPRPGMMPPPGMPMRARGGRLPKGTKVWREGRADGTQVQNNPAGKNDQHDVERGKPITYAKGGSVRRAGGGHVGPLDKEMGYQTLKNSMVADREAGDKALQNEQMQNADDISASLRGKAKGGAVKRRATGGAVHYFGSADMGIPHPFKGKDFSTPMATPKPKKGPNDPPGEGKMPSDRAVMKSAHEARGHGHASIGKGPFAPGTMKEPKPFSGPDEHPKGLAGYNVKGGAGGARARIAKIKKYGP